MLTVRKIYLMFAFFKHNLPLAVIQAVHESLNESLIVWRSSRLSLQLMGTMEWQRRGNAFILPVQARTDKVHDLCCDTAGSHIQQAVLLK